MQADPQDIRRAAGIFKALSHPSRLKIVCLLFDGRCRTQKQLVEELSWPQSTTARHLSHLREKGLVSVTRQGAEVQLELGSHVTKQIMGAVCEWVHPETGEQFAGSYSQRLAQEAE